MLKTLVWVMPGPEAGSPIFLELRTKN